MKVFHFLLCWTAVVVLSFGSAAPVLAQRPLGIDVSSFQGSADSPKTNINWTNVKSSGISFAWAKATEGLTVNDADFIFNETNAQSAGVLIGAYHYAHPENHLGLSGADVEADHFWGIAQQFIQGGGSYMMPMLDIEQQPGSSYTKASLSAWVNEWCDRLAEDAATSNVTVHPVVYTFVSYATQWLDNTVTQRPLWMAQYPATPKVLTGTPSSISPWSAWFFWQYSSTNFVSGITGQCDVDVFNGSTNGLMTSFVIGNVPPQNLSVNAGSNAMFSVTAGGSALNYQWQFNQINIPGATATNFTISNAQLSSAGAYSVIVSNASGPLFTATASLGVVPQLSNAVGAILAPPNLVGWWPAEGNPNDIFGTNDFVPFNFVSYTAGEQDLAFQFDGSTSYLSNNVASMPVPWTICLWVNRQNALGAGAALTGDGTNELKLEQFNGTRKVGYTKFGVGDFIFSPNYTMPVGTWTHLAFTGTSAGTSLYVNGIFQASLTNIFPLPRAYFGAGYVASTGEFVDYMRGSLDEIMIFNRALSSTEINAIFATGSAGLVRAPEFTGSFPLAGGNFQLNFKGQTGKGYTIHSSTDLITWKNLGAVPNPSGTNQFTDNTATNLQTFYRLSQP